MPSLARPQPPTRGSASHTRARVSDAAVLAVLTVLLVAGVTVWDSLGLRFPSCWFLGATGVPCPTCGSTRALLGLGHADFPLAFARNPLLAIAAVFLLFHAAVTMLEQQCEVQFLDPVRRAFSARWTSVLVAALAVANWVYLIVTLP